MCTSVAFHLFVHHYTSIYWGCDLPQRARVHDLCQISQESESSDRRNFVAHLDDRISDTKVEIHMTGEMRWGVSEKRTKLKERQWNWKLRSVGLHSGTWAKLHYYCATCRSQPYCQYYKKSFNSRFHIIQVVKFRDTTSSTKLDVLDTSFQTKYCYMYMLWICDNTIVTVIVFPCHWALPVHN